MQDDPILKLDAEALALFARKGLEAGSEAPQTGEANGVKVRRILQLTRDLTGSPLSSLRILDLGCGEGVYSIEAGLRGAQVVGVDARIERMEQGAACAARHGLGAVRFLQDDVRRVTRESHGEFDVVYLLGILYHLDAPDLFEVLEQVHAICSRLLIVDTLVGGTVSNEVEWRGHVYRGERHREHGDADSAEVRRSRWLRSIDNTFAFRLDRESLWHALHNVGFTSVLECHVPLEPGKATDRMTVAAVKGRPVQVATYPWINGSSEAEIARRLGPPLRSP